LPELLPEDPRAASVARRVRTLAEVLDRAGFVAGGGAASSASAGPSAALTARGPSAAAVPPALSQPHCHQQAILGLAADRRVRERNGISVGTELSGCCGLAGNFGA